MIERRMRLTWVIGALSLVAAAVWAFIPDSRSDVIAPMLRAPAAAEDEGTDSQPLDPLAFTALLWNPPPSPPPPVPKTEDDVRMAERRPLLLQLIGIIEEDGQPRRAALYDPQADKLLIVADGESVEPYRVIRITSTMIELSDGRATRRLALVQGREPS